MRTRKKLKFGLRMSLSKLKRLWNRRLSYSKTQRSFKKNFGSLLCGYTPFRNFAHHFRCHLLIHFDLVLDFGVKSKRKFKKKQYATDISLGKDL